MPIFFIAILIAIQSVLYLTTQKLGGNARRPLILTACLLTNFFLLPWATIPLMLPPNIHCGNPAIGIMLAYWMFGTVPILICHVIFVFLNNRVVKQEIASQLEQKQ